MESNDNAAMISRLSRRGLLLGSLMTLLASVAVFCLLRSEQESSDSSNETKVAKYTSVSGSSAAGATTIPSGDSLRTINGIENSSDPVAAGKAVGIAIQEIRNWEKSSVIVPRYLNDSVPLGSSTTYLIVPPMPAETLEKILKSAAAFVGVDVSSFKSEVYSFIGDEPHLNSLIMVHPADEKHPHDEGFIYHYSNDESPFQLDPETGMTGLRVSRPFPVETLKEDGRLVQRYGHLFTLEEKASEP